MKKIIKITLLITIANLLIYNCNTFKSKDHYYLENNEIVLMPRITDIIYDVMDVVSISIETPSVGFKVIAGEYELGLFGQGLPYHPNFHSAPSASGLGLRSGNISYCSREIVSEIKSYSDKANLREQYFPCNYGRNKQYQDNTNPDKLNTYIYGRIGFEIAFFFGLRFEVNALEFIDFFYNFANQDLLNDNFYSYNKPYDQVDSISIHGADLNQFPNAIKKLTNLKRLDLSYNKITAIPYYIDRLNKLEFLDLSFNRLTYLPNEFKNIKNLKTLHIKQNMDIINWEILCPLVSLQELEMRVKEFNQPLFGDNCLTNLKKFSVDSISQTKRKSDFLLGISSLENLETLDIHGLDIIELPDEIGNLSKLKTLILGKPIYPNKNIRNLKYLQHIKFEGFNTKLTNMDKQNIYNAWIEILPPGSKIEFRYR